MKVGIISFAHMHAHGYANALQMMEKTEFTAIYDDDSERGKAAAEKYNVPFFDSLDEFLSQDIDAVIVTSENINHYSHVAAAATYKKNVLCEKPLATTTQDAKKLIAVCEDNGVKLQTAFPVRFNSSIVQTKQLLDEGNLGRILAIKGTNRGKNPGGWFTDKTQSGGGAVIDHTVHVVDIMRWFMKSEIKEVYAEIDQLFSDKPIDDAGVLTMEFDNGVFATLDCSWSKNKNYPAGADVTLEIVGTKGTVTIDAFQQNLNIFTDDSGYSQEFWGDDMDFELVHDFLFNPETSITGEDGLKALEVALAAYRSSDEKQPVLLNE